MMHYLISQAYKGLYPEKEMDFGAKLKYSKAFKAYNANVKYTKTQLNFRLSYNWKDVSDEIKIGLLQSLFNKIYGSDISTLNIELYSIFLKKIPRLSPKLKQDPLLADSFERINKDYFNSIMMMPNLEFGGDSFHTLGTYDYSTDTIRISRLLLKDTVLLDYVMYHEMLHKRFNYGKINKRTIHHTKEFRDWEKKFKLKDIDDKLKSFLKKERL